MDTGRLKRFSTEARTILMQGVAHRITSLGFLPDGSVTEEPQRMGGGATFMGDTVSEDFYQKWVSLRNAVTARSLEEVAEEAAYTWFNRLVAIRIMVMNGLIAPVLQYESEGVHIPLLVSEARQGRMPEMDADDLRKLNDLLADDSQTAEQFRILIVAFCHSNPVINSCFGHISDYTELLLPTNILAEGGFVDMLNNTAFISDEDYHSPELIGWLYQFYISEKKDDVFANFKKGKKAEAKDIPAATQIFTPNWIVKYMVQNTIGRIYLDNNPYETDIQKNWRYLVEPSEPTPKDCILHYDDLKELKFGDLACGSGHILNEGFDILYDLYILEGYSRKQAIENIFRYNLTGVDIDTRAKQLAQFALLLKACQKDSSFADAHLMPKVLDMPKVDRYTWRDLGGHMTCALQISMDDECIYKELDECFALMEQAQNLGSIMKFEVSEPTRAFIIKCIEEQNKQHQYEKQFADLFQGFELILALTEQYAALVMNPPYMGGGNMNGTLSDYVKQNYEEGKADLFSTFMLLAIDRLADEGKYGMINMHSWMFLSSFERLRKSLLDNYHIDSLLHLGPRTFDELSGEVVQNAAFVVSNYSQCGNNLFPDREQNIPNPGINLHANDAGTYFRLVDGKNCGDKERMFLDAQANHTAKIYYPNVEQKNFEKIPGSPIGYWVNDSFVQSFSKTPLGDNVVSSPGIRTGRDSIFIREWFEVSNKRLSLNGKEEADLMKGFWFPITRGGERRRWYGNLSAIIYGANSFEKVKEICNDYRLRETAYYFKKGTTWTMISSGKPTFRVCPQGVLFGNGGPTLYSETNYLKYIAILNTDVAAYYYSLLNPTINYTKSDIEKLPILDTNNDDIINSLANQNISISKLDWDSHETSWDFEKNELLKMDAETLMEHLDYYCDKVYRETGQQLCIDPAAPEPERLEWCYNMYCKKWEDKYDELHRNEEELNRQFIEIYGLQDELTPDVPLDEITILQQGEITIEDNQLKWNADVVMKQLISYAVGCMMGRYSIDKPGLILANQGDGLEHYHAQVQESRFEPDDDGIIPLMSAQSDFSDNASLRFKQWLVAAFGEDTLVENLNFLEASLGKSIDDYFVKDFWKDHKKMYQNRPIYWLFASKKGAFQCLAYMHRMDAYTAERIRTKYLLPHIEWLIQKKAEMEANAANLNTRERKELDSISKQIDECREYHDRLHVIADEQISFDLDDGVVVNYAKFGDVLSKIK